MKNIYLLSILLILAFSSCNKKKTEAKDTEKSEKAAVQHTSISHPIVTVAGKPDAVIIGKPNAVASEKTTEMPMITNERQAMGVKENIFNKGTVATPGSPGVSAPKKFPVAGIKIICRQPIPTPALPMSTKDNSTCNIQYFDMEMGMNDNYVNAICEDRNRIIWIGTNSGGLSRYDGKSFIHYTKKEGFISNTINTIIADKAGNIWIGTDKGVCKYDGQTFVQYTEKEGICNNNVLHILEDKTGNIWFGTAIGVTEYDWDVFTNFTKNEGMSSNEVKSLYEDNKGHIWIGTNNDGVYNYNEKSFIHYDKQEGLIGNTITSIVQDKKNNMWFGTENGLCKFDGSSYYNYSNGYGTIVSSIEDKSGNLWFGSSANGIIKYDGNMFTQLTVNEGLSDNNVTSIIEDNTGILWFGTEGGVDKYVPKSFIHYEAKELFEYGDMPISEDKEGKVWTGTVAGKVGIYDGKSFTIYKKTFTNSNKTPASILSILKDKNGNMWVGTKGGGVYKYDGKVFTNYTSREGLIDNTVNSITEDRLGNIWLGTNGGISKYDGNSFYNYNSIQGLADNTVYSIFEDDTKNIWIGTNNGISKFDLKTFTTYSTKQGLINNKVRSVIQDKSDNIWIATDSGVSNYNPSIAADLDANPFNNYSEKEGLSSNIINSIAEDKKGNIWITTNKGLDIITKEEMDNTNGELYIFKITKKDGLKDNGFNKNSAFIDSKGRAWWGNAKSLSMLDLNSYTIPEQKPVMHLNTIELEQKFIDYNLIKDTTSKDSKVSTSFDRIRKSLSKMKNFETTSFYNYPLNLKLPYDLNYLTFQFSAIDWQAPQKLQYQYMVQGIDKDWSPLTQANMADYRSIPAGRYTFKVRAIGIANKFSDPIEYPFEITEPWWGIWWVRGLCVCGGLLLIGLLFQWRTASLRKNQKELEQIVYQRTAEVVDEKREVERQKEVVERKNKEITDSIEYALRIQTAILPASRIVKEYVDNSFILYKPKDIVAGDFYWMETVEMDNMITDTSGKRKKKQHSTNVLIAACDCTGHGVPGAMVSVVCHNALNRAVREFGLTEPAAILDKTAEIVIENFSKSEEEIKDGMDISLASIKYVANSKHVEVEWAGANNPLWIIQNGELIETKADKQPIGMYENNKAFTNKKFILNEGDCVYLFTDGFADQFGGETGLKKLTRRRFKNLLLSLGNLNMHEQGIALDNFINVYRKDIEQVDDILVMGIKV